MKTIFGSRKNHYLQRVGIFLIVLTLVAGMIISCDGGAEYDLTMAVAPPGSGTATDLTGTSPYASGTVVSIKAVAAAGYKFVNWTTSAGGTFVDPNAPTTNFTMPAQDVTVTANFESGLCVDFEDLPLGTQYHVGDTFTDSGIVIAVQKFQWGNLEWCNGNCGYTEVSDNSSWCWPGGSGQHMVVNNVNLNFTVAFSWEGLSLLFGEYGGNLNIEINGDFRNFENFQDIDGDIIGGVDVSVVNGFGNDRGSLNLSGTINSFTIGGQELCIDDVCITGPFEGTSLCVDFEDLLLGTQYHVGDTFADSDVAIAVQKFQWGNLVWCNGNCGYTEVSNNLSWCWPGGSGQHMVVNNVNLRFVYDGPWEGLSLLFGEYGGNLNIEINGDFRNFENFDDIDGDVIGGVDVSVVNGLGNDRGSLTLSGTINSFAIGGQELCIDDVCITIPS